MLRKTDICTFNLNVIFVCVCVWGGLETIRFKAVGVLEVACMGQPHVTTPHPPAQPMKNEDQDSYSLFS